LTKPFQLEKLRRKSRETKLKLKGPMESTHQSKKSDREKPAGLQSLFSNRLMSLYLVCLLGCLGLRSEASSYYVDPQSGSDSSNGTTTANAWAHIPGAVGFTGSGWAMIGAGDMVIVKGGSTNNYRVKFDSAHYSGAAAFDTFTIVSGDKLLAQWGTTPAIIDGQNTRHYGIAIDAVSGGTFDGFEIREIKDGADMANEVWGNGNACIEFGAISGRPTHWKIRRCYLHHAYGTTADHGFGIEFYGPDVNMSCTDIIEYNTIANVRTKCLELYGTNHVVRANFFTKSGDHNVVFTCDNSDYVDNVNYVVHPDNGIAEVNGAFVHSPVFGIKINKNNNDCWNNVIFCEVGSASDNPNGFGTGFSPNNASYNRLLFNTVIQSTTTQSNNRILAFDIGDEGVLGTNNIVALSIGAYFTSSAGVFGDVQFFTGDLTKNGPVRYCDFYRTSSSANVIANHYGGTYHALNTATAMSTSPDVNGNSFDSLQQSDPAFTGGNLPSGLDSSFLPNTSYFVLTASTPSAIRVTGQNGYTGTSTNGSDHTSTKFATDILGNTRTNWSMGAYEYSVGGGGGGGGTEVGDTFTDTDNTTLASHATTTGGYAWVLVNQEFHISGGQLVSTSAPAGISRYYVNHTMSSANYTAAINTINNSGTSNDECSLGIRDNGASGSSRTAYYVTWFPDLAIARLYKVLSGTSTQLGSDLSIGNCTNLSIQASGTTITAKANGTQIASVSDSSIASAGFVGIGSGYRGARDNFHIAYDNLTVTVP
jgi:hypothetical protein